ncbi:MAG: HAD-IA family hydrolase [Mariprofundaceae bacterium]
MKTRLILFDCDGTLVDSQSQITDAMQAAFHTCDITPPSRKKIEAIIGLSLKQAVQCLAVDDEEYWPALESEYRKQYTLLESKLQLYPNVTDVLATLQQRGYWLGIVTGKGRQGLLRILEQFQLAPYFLTWRSADCCASKPDPAMAIECMDELGVHVSECAIIGDARYDMQMAAACGAAAYGVSFGVESAQVLKSEGAITVFDHFSEISNHFAESAAS